jgi:HSP20 family protein
MRFIHFTQPDARSSSPARFGGRLGLSGIENELDWLFGAALTGNSRQTRDAQFPVDVYEDKQNTYVRAELPGTTHEAINVEIIDGSLSIKASRQAKTGEGESTVPLSRLVSVSDEVQADKVSALYENGILTVTLPRREEVKPRKINVSVN